MPVTVRSLCAVATSAPRARTLTARLIHVRAPLPEVDLAVALDITLDRYAAIARRADELLRPSGQSIGTIDGHARLLPAACDVDADAARVLARRDTAGHTKTMHELDAAALVLSGDCAVATRGRKAGALTRLRNAGPVTRDDADPQPDADLAFSLDLR